MDINAISKMPANSPPRNATISHQVETIWVPPSVGFVTRQVLSAPATPATLI
jgi:hypothetical protein